MRIGWKTEEVVRDARFFPHFCHNMPLPWQHSFCHCRKMCLAHLHSKANISAKFHENWSKTEEVVRDARLATDRPTAVTMATLFLSLSKNVSCTSTLQGKHLCQISWELVKNWGSSSRRKIGDRPPDRIGDRPPDDTLIPIYPPLYTTCMRGYNKWSHVRPGCLLREDKMPWLWHILFSNLKIFPQKNYHNGIINMTDRWADKQNFFFENHRGAIAPPPPPWRHAWSHVMDCFIFYCWGYR